jgi:hypothetical protein
MLNMIRIAVLILILFFVGSSHSEAASEAYKNNQATKIQTNANEDQFGTDKFPLVVKTIPSNSTEAQTKQEEQEEKKEHANNERNIMYATVVLAIVTAILAFFTFRLWSATKTMVESTDTFSKDQLVKMEKSIKEATRAAAAMETLAKSADISSKAATESVTALKERTAQQMRAYLTVVIGGATYQDRAKNLKFAGRPRLVNTGHTPAHNVGFKSRAAILPVQLPEDFDFPLPDEIVGATVLGPNQFHELNGVVDDFVPDDEVESIKHAQGRVLHIWGLVTYEDVFGEHRVTRFCQALTWVGEGKDEIIFGYYNSRHNDAT